MFVPVVGGVALGGGDPRLLLHPSDSHGALCGQGELASRPNLFHFAVGRCAGLEVGLGPVSLVEGVEQAAVRGCPTPAVCVSDCPAAAWDWSQGKTEHLRQFCVDMADSSWEEFSMEDLVRQQSEQPHITVSE